MAQHPMKVVLLDLDGTLTKSDGGIIASVVIAELIGVTMYLLAPQLVAFFSPTPDVIALGTRQMRTTALFFCLLAYSHAVASICRGAGKAFVPTQQSAFRPRKS